MAGCMGRPCPEARIALSEVGGLPTDWTEHEALVLELRASSSQRMNLKIYTGQEDPDSGEPLHSRILFHPYPNVWIRAAIPIALLAEPPKTGHDMAAVGNRSRNGYFVSLWGPFASLDDVTALAFEMEHPVDSPTLEIRSVALATTTPGDAILDGLDWLGLTADEGPRHLLFIDWDRLAGDTERQATSGEIKDLRREMRDLKEALADVLLENRLLKKSMLGDGGGDI